MPSARGDDINSVANCTSNSISCISEPDYSAIGCSSISEPYECTDNYTYRSTNLGADDGTPISTTIKSSAVGKSNLFTYSCASIAKSHEWTVILTSKTVDNDKNQTVTS